MPKIFKLFLIIVAFFLAVFLFVFFSYFWLQKNYDQKIFPNVFVGNIDLGGKTADQAKDFLYDYLDSANLKGIEFVYEDVKTTIYPMAPYFLNNNSANILINFDVEKAVVEAKEIGRRQTLSENFFDVFFFFFKKRIDLPVSMDEENILKDLRQGFKKIEPANAGFSVDNNNHLIIVPEKQGISLDYKKALAQAIKNLKYLDFSPIALRPGKQMPPEIITADCESLKNQVEKLINLSPIGLRYENKNIDYITASVLADWAKVKKSEKEESLLYLDEDEIREYLKEKIEPLIKKEPIATKFSFRNGSLQKTNTAKTGLELNFDLTVSALKDLQNNPVRIINLSVTKLSVADIKSSSIYGIKELIGKNSTEIISSSANRLKNIKNGAFLITGLLVAPGEEFSLLDVLQPFDDTNGFVKESVIQNGEMVADFGGGLCQLSTTFFRALLDAGLSITERTNHTYWLVYYNPPGTDATIFDPAPDLKFVNDTNNYILIQSNVDNKLNLNIELWGTKDGRIAEKTEPVIYNIVYPGKAKMIPSWSLPRGEIDCFSPAYKGADTYFDYAVTYQNGAIKKQRFRSHYVPSRAVCYIGQ